MESQAGGREGRCSVGSVGTVRYLNSVGRVEREGKGRKGKGRATAFSTHVPYRTVLGALALASPLLVDPQCLGPLVERVRDQSGQVSGCSFSSTDAYLQYGCACACAGADPRCSGSAAQQTSVQLCTVQMQAHAQVINVQAHTSRFMLQDQIQIQFQVQFGSYNTSSGFSLSTLGRASWTEAAGEVGDGWDGGSRCSLFAMCRQRTEDDLTVGTCFFWFVSSDEMSWS